MLVFVKYDNLRNKKVTEELKIREDLLPKKKEKLVVESTLKS
jgi:hypothetical protein